MKKITLFLSVLFISVVSMAAPLGETDVQLTDNNLNPYAYGLESKLSTDKSTLHVTYCLNNSRATEVTVVLYNGEEVLRRVIATNKLGVNTIAVPVGGLPGGVKLTWAVEVNGTSVAAPALQEKIYSFYHPSGVDIDNNPENETFGTLLVNEGMHEVKDITGYVSSGFGAGIFAFTPSFDLIPNGELAGYNGGVEFTKSRADNSKATAYSPRRIRISEDGRIFVTSLNTDGNYLWEVNPENMNEWTPVFAGTLNDNKELVDAEGNFIAAPNTGFDVKGAGENLQLAMYSVNLPGITAAAMSGFRLHEYNLGTATEWTSAPTKVLNEGKYAINYTGTQVEYDNEGGFWIASHREAANEANPGLVHINADGVEDAKLVWSNVRQAGIRFNKDFTKLVVAGVGEAGTAQSKKATVYTISKDENGAPVLTEEVVVDMAVVGNNLNDFAWDYAGNLYACGNSSEKLAAWAMPYSGQVVTPAAAKYAFELDVQHHAIEITNLVVTTNGEYELLEGSEKTYGIAVALNVDANGNLQEGSSISRDGQALPIVSSSAITKTYDEALATDVYTATILVKNLGGVMGLDLTMYNSGDTSDGEIDVVITDAQFTIETYPDGMGGTYQVVDMTANWKDGTLSVMGLDLNQKGFMMMNYQTTSDFFSWMCYDATVQTINNVVTITGQFECMYTHNIYNVNISGELPNSETDLENTPVEAAPVKIIRDGQLLIMKNGVQYNANGAQL